jgi:peptide/nickel transport system permease protein
MSELMPTRLDAGEDVGHRPLGEEIEASDGDAGSAGTSLRRAVLSNPLGLFAVTMLTIIILASFVGRYFTPHTPDDLDIGKILAAPGDGYLLGGDASGRDVFTMLIWGGRSTLLGAFLAVAVAVSLGATSGLIAGYFGRTFDAVSSWIANVILALPGMIVLLALYQAVGASVYSSMAVFGVLLAPGFFRLTRNQVIAVKHELYIDAAKVSGLSNARIIGRHVLSAVRSPIIIQISIVAGIAIIIQAGLSFLGLGDSNSWGGQLSGAFQSIRQKGTLVIWPGAAIALTVMSFVLLANAIRDALRRQRAGLSSEPQRTADPELAATASLTGEIDRDALLVVDGLTIGYGSSVRPKVVVDNVSFHVAEGEILGLVGESGSGKSQTTFAIQGLLPPGGRIISGSIRFRGRELTTLSASGYRAIRGREIAYVPQEPMSNLDPTFTVGFQLVEPMRAVLGLSKRDARARALSLLERVGIPDPKRTFRAYPHQISGGMAQRVLIAGAISCEPALLIADEPTTALDVTVQAEILDLLRTLQADTGMAIILVTHDFGVVADICERVAVMQTGELVEVNDALTLFDAPRHPYTQMLLGSTLDDAEPRGPLVPAGGG